MSDGKEEKTPMEETVNFLGKGKERERMREESDKAIKEFLKNGGKITKVAEGEFTEAKDMKYKFRKPAFGGKKKTE